MPALKGERKQIEPIEAADIELTGLAIPEAESRAQSAAVPANADTRRTVIRYGLALALLGSLALIAVYFQSIGGRQETVIGENTKQPIADVPTSVAPASPYEQQQKAAARRAAQDVLARVVEKQRQLEASAVSEWAGTAFASAIERAESGDRLYRQARYEVAQKAYLQSEKELDAIGDSLAGTLEKMLKEALAAIESGDEPTARATLETVLRMQPAHAEAQQALERVAKLPQVMAVLTEAEDRLSKGAPEAAQALFSQALTLDSQSRRGQSGLAESRRILSERAFQSALDAGYQALEAGNFSAAVRKFNQALSEKPDSETTRQALVQAQNELNQSRERSWLEAAKEHEAAERWVEAVTAYDKVIASDSSVVAARTGRLRSQARADLDSQLQKLIGAPLRLSSPSVLREARQALSDAQKVRPDGPRINQQVERLEVLLQGAVTPRPVVVQSDNETRVSVLRLGELGQFREKTIELRPGKYVAEGVRPGYRDVRVDFVVSGESEAPILVACTEPI